jgi:hypothetical protein
MENKVIAVQFGNKIKSPERSAYQSGVQSTHPVSLTDVSLTQQPTHGTSAVDIAEVATGNKSDLMSLADRNRANQERVRKERDLANKAVLKSYRIK